MALGERSEEERSLRDDLAAGLKDIEEREASAAPVDEGAKAPEAEANAEAPETQSDRGDGRDAHGRFVSKTANGNEQTSPDRPSSEQSSPPVEQGGKEAEATPEKEQSPEGDQPPKSWRADEAKAWAQLPPEAKAAILRREADAAKIAGQNDNERMFGREMADIFRPHIQEIQASGASPQQAVKILLANHNALRSNDPQVKFTKARELLHQYGIDPAQLTEIQMPDQNIAELRNHIAQLEQRIANPQGSNFAPLPPSQEEGNIIAEIEAFRADPAHPHFDAVHARMGQLLETGAAPDLESAYQAAVAMDSALRSTVAPQAPQRTQEERTAAARRASASVTSSPGPTGQQVPLTMRDELAEGLRNAGFRV